MKKIVGMVAAATMLAGTAFAEVSWSAALNISDDVVTYEAPTRSGKITDSNSRGTDDNGKVTWNKDIAHAEDVTLNATGSKAGAKIAFKVTGPADGSDTAVTVGTYHLWGEVLPNLKIHAGAYKTRLQKGINDDGEWDTTLSAISKIGLINEDIAKLDGTDKIGVDATNVTSRIASNEWNNFMAEYAVNDNITAYAAMFLKSGGWSDGSWTHDNHVSRFSPWAVAANVNLNKDSKVSFVVKNESTQKLTLTGVTYEAASLEAGNLDKILSGTKHGYIYATDRGAITVSGGYSTWTANVDFATKVADWGLEAAYTFAGLFYDNYDTIYGHHTSFYTTSSTNLNGYNIADKNVYAHGFDLRAAGELGDKLGITAVANLTYRQPTKYDIHHTYNYGSVRYNLATNTLDTSRAISDRTTYKNKDAFKAEKGLSGQLAHYESVSIDYAISSRLTFQFQALHKNTNIYDVAKESETYVTVNGTRTARSAVLANITGLEAGYFAPRKEVDVLKNSTVTARPAVIYEISKAASLSCGVQFDFSNLSALKRNSGDDNFTTTVSVPVTFKLDL